MGDTQEILLDIRDRLARLETKMDDMQTAKNKAYEAYNIAIQNSKDISEIKEEKKWMKRTMIGLIGGMIIQVIIVALTLYLGGK